MNLLVLAIDGRGMGHLKRCTLLAEALRDVAPAAKVHFVIESPAVHLVEGAGFPVLKLPDPLHPVGQVYLAGRRAALERDVLVAAISQVRPRAVLLDFVVDRDLFSAIRKQGCRVILVLRRLRAAAMRELRSHPAMDLVDTFLLPHRRSEFGDEEIPARWQEKCVFMGPVVRRLRTERIDALRAEYAGPNEKLVLLTAGGGGWAQATELIHEGERAIGQLLNERTDVRALVVPGPLSEAPLGADSERCRHLRQVPDMPELMAAADLVVASAGYNTVQELQGAGTPAVLVPMSNPGHDDQRERALNMQRAGRATVVDLTSAAIWSALRLALDGQGPVKVAPAGENDVRQIGQIMARLLSS